MLMHFFKYGSIRKNLTFLVFLSILPAFAILFYTGFEHRQHIIESTKQDVALIVRGMAEKQKEITRSTKLILTTLSNLPAIRQLNIEESTRILSEVAAQNPLYNNLALVDLGGRQVAHIRINGRTHLVKRKARQRIGQCKVSRPE